MSKIDLALKCSAIVLMNVISVTVIHLYMCGITIKPVELTLQGKIRSINPEKNDIVSV